jgi:6-phosphogluconolactonase
MRPALLSHFSCVALLLLFAVGAFAQASVPKFLFVDNEVDGTVSAFQVEPLTGQLIEVTGSPFNGGYAIQGIALTPDNKFVYTAGNAVFAFVVNQTTGELTEVGSYPINGDLGKAVITGNGKFLYAFGDGIYGFSIDSSTGALTPIPGSPFDVKVSFGGGTVDPTSQYLYAPQLLPQPTGVRGYAIQESGALFTLTGSPFADSNTPIDMVADPSGRFVYAANYGGGLTAGVSGFSIAPGQGTLTPLPNSPYATGGQATLGIAASPNGRAIVTSNQAESTTASLSIQQDGSLVLAGTPQPTGLNPGYVAIDTTSEFVYTSATSASTVSAYRFDPVTLALEVVPGTWQTGSTPYQSTVLAGPQSPYCPLNNVEPSITLCTPTATSTSPMRIVAGTTSATPIQKIMVLVDGVKTYENSGAEAMDVFVDVPSGNHSVVLQARNSAGQNFSLTRGITVIGSDTSRCGNRGILPTVSICSPLAGSQTGTSIHLIAQSAGVNLVSSTAVYLDGKEVYSVYGAAVNTYLNAAPGVHALKVQSTDDTGLLWSSTAYVTVQ